MPRKNQIEIKSETCSSKSDEFVYCGLRKCPHIKCLRHNVNTPFNVIIRRRNFNPDKEWNCKDMEV